MDRDFTQEICELIRMTATDIPCSVEKRLHAAMEQEIPGSAAYGAMLAILKNIETARNNSTPICQDTGIPIFFVHYPSGMNMDSLIRQIRQAVEIATKRSYLRPNAVDSLSGENIGNNVGDRHFPSIHFAQGEGDELTIELMLKGGGCENVGTQYSLPDEHLKAGRDLEGVRKVVLDAVYRAQGEGCAPGFLGVAIGGDRGTSYAASKEVLLRDLDDDNPVAELKSLEERITREANQLGIGPMGFGGQSTVLGTKIASLHRLPACYFVTVSYMCWAFRKRKMTVTNSGVNIE